jgi:hypothetical protein
MIEMKYNIDDDLLEYLNEGPTWKLQYYQQEKKIKYLI